MNVRACNLVIRTFDCSMKGVAFGVTFNSNKQIVTKGLQSTDLKSFRQNYLGILNSCYFYRNSFITK